MKRIFQIIESNKVLFKNFTSLSVLQISIYLFPLITLPYLVRVLGPEKYGLVNFAAAFAAYFTIITDYGFNLSATQEISINRENSKRVSEIFSSVLTLKMLFFILSTMIFCAVVFLVPLFREHMLLFFVTFLSVLGTALFPLWFYQGIEKMNYILIITVSVRLIITVLIFVIIKNENDFIKLAGLNTAAQFVIGFIGLLVAMKKLKIKYIFPKKSLLKLQMQNGWNLFLSTVSINLYTTSNVFILGLFAPANVVGYFAAADKIRMAFMGILSPISQSVFPYVNKLVNESYDKFILFIKRLLKIQTMLGFLISLLLFTFSFQITDLLLGQKFVASGVLLRIISGIPFLISISNVFCIQTMLPLGFDKAFTKVFGSAALIHILLLSLFVPKFLAIGTSVSAVITELVVLLLTFLTVVKNKILFVKEKL